MKETTGATSCGGEGTPYVAGGDALEAGGVRTAEGGEETTATGGGDGVEHMGPLAVTTHTKPEQQVPVLQKVPRLRQEAVGGPDRLATGGGVAPPVPMPMPVPVPLGAHVIMPMGSAVHCPEQQSEA